MTLSQLTSKTRYYGWFYEFVPTNHKTKQWVGTHSKRTDVLYAGTETGVQTKIRSAVEEECTA